MTDSSNRYGDQPLGKSVEEIEREGGNLENSPVQGEDRRRDDGLVVPAVIGGTTSGAPGRWWGWPAGRSHGRCGRRHGAQRRQCTA
ncbi:hypothetical protein ACFSC4_08755 [Deinococcus malanensis]|uniref:hypothetical protein n=1 Tax=Deinococcus malanensis TaxID=1706855 RepID=UPI003637FCCD